MINVVVLNGRLTANPELKSTANGVAVTSFSLAVQRNRKNADGEYDVDFIEIVAWRNNAEFVCKYAEKGDTLGIDGTIQTRKYQDKNGNNRTAVEVVANNINLLYHKKADTQPGNDTQNVEFEELSDNGDLPF